MFLTVIYLFIPFSSAFAEKKAHLHYLPNTPVHLSSEVTLDISQTLPGLSLATRGKQNINAILTVSSEQSGLPITQPPFDLTFVLKALRIDLRVNDEEISFDSSRMESSLFLSQVSKMIDRPIRIYFGEDFKLEGGSAELRRIVKELPILQEVHPENLLVELFMPLFALGGQELIEGKTFKRDQGDHFIPSMPNVVEYTITNIDDYNVYANINGKIEKREFQLEGLVQTNDKKEEVVGVRLSGMMNGKVKWNRDNAMLYDLDMEYTYSAKFKLGEWEWMMNVSLDVQNRTKLRTGV
ncbi:MAG: hypothetical protein ACE5GN_01400 [Waddliaceae bacterium]